MSDKIKRPVHLSVMRQQIRDPHLWNHEAACGLLWDEIGSQTAVPHDANCPECLTALVAGLPKGVVLSRDGVGEDR